MAEPLNIHLSDISTLKECPKKFEYQVLKNLIRNDSGYEQSFGVKDFGTLGHQVLHDYYKDGVALLDTLFLLKDKFPAEIEMDDDDDGKKAKVDPYTLAENIFIGYAKHWGTDPFSVMSVEQTYTKYYPEYNINLIATPDLLVQLPNGDTAFVDHKFYTKATMDEDYNMMADQFSGYSWFFNEELGIPVDHMILNTIVKDYPKPPKMLVSNKFSVDKRQKCTVETFVQACEAANQNPSHYHEYLQFLEANPRTYFHRESILRTKRQRDIWGQELHNILKFITTTKFFWRTPSTFAGGSHRCRGCQFNHVCRTEYDQGDTTTAIKYGYRQKTADER